MTSTLEPVDKVQISIWGRNRREMDKQLHQLKSNGWRAEGILYESSAGFWYQTLSKEVDDGLLPVPPDSPPVLDIAPFNGPDVVKNDDS